MDPTVVSGSTRRYSASASGYVTCPRRDVSLLRHFDLSLPVSRPPIPAALRVSRIRALRGPNYWRLAPVIACDVRLGELEELTSIDVPGFCDRLVEALPSLREHPCSRGVTGGFVDRLREGTHWPHVLEHVALELQTLAGSDVG